MSNKLVAVKISPPGGKAFFYVLNCLMTQSSDPAALFAKYPKLLAACTSQGGAIMPYVIKDFQDQKSAVCIDNKIFALKQILGNSCVDELSYDPRQVYSNLYQQVMPYAMVDIDSRTSSLNQVCYLNYFQQNLA